MQMFTSAEINRNLGLLIIRLASGGLMAFLHGWPKLVGFIDKMDSFPDPLHVGSIASLTLTVFAEFFCALLIVLGVFTRPAAIILSFTMFVAAFVVHSGDPLGEREMAMFFLAAYLTIFFNGSGKYSLNRLSFR
jgi:putative oxidoreductase